MPDPFGYFVLAVLLALSVFLFLTLRRMLEKTAFCLEGCCQSAKENYHKRLEERNELDSEIKILEKSLEETIALYAVTKAICKSLDKDKVFSLFKEQLKKYTGITDCRIIERQENKEGISPLLVCDTQEGEEMEKFNIMSQQFLLGFKRAVLYERIQELSITDVLTETLSRRHALERLDDELERSKKMKLAFAVLMIDLDRFKEINDTYGHLVGDVVLSEVAGVIKANIREIDLIGRYGGEEFLIILTETGKAEAGLAAERIRKAVEGALVRAYDEELHVTISIGVAVFPADGVSGIGLIEKADSALYRAKNTGRNRVCV